MAVYECIPVTGSLIRVLRLLPTPGPIRCELFATSLDQPPSFEALSYRWGDPSNNKSIEVNGHPMEVTPNLLQALLALRQQEPRLLWIDQLCIDQNSKADKEKQIPLMGSIYSKAAETVAWLGAGTKSSDRAIEYLDQAGKFGTFVKINDLNIIHEGVLKLRVTYPDPSIQARHMDTSDVLRLRLDEIIERWGEWQDMGVVNDVIELFSNTYFTRGWVKQEIAIPPVLTLRAGSKTLNIETFKAGFVVFQSHYHYSAMRFRAKDAALLGTSKALTATHRAEMSKRLHLEDDSHRLIHPTLRTRDLYQNGSKQARNELTLERLLRRFGRQVAFTEPRDRMYGFGGLASDAGPLGLNDAIDLSKSWEQIHTLFMRKVISHNGIHMLEHVQYPKSSAQLPSWVPDFSCKSHLTLTEVTMSSTDEPFAAGISKEHASSTIIEAANIDWDDNTLRCEGWILDTIAKVGRGWGDGINASDLLIPISLGAVPLCEDITVFCIESAHIQTLNPDFATNAYGKRQAATAWRILALDHERIDSAQPSHRATQQSARGYSEVKNLFAWTHLIHRKATLELTTALLPEHTCSAHLRKLPEAKRELVATKSRLSNLAFPRLSQDGMIFFGSLGELENHRPFLTARGYVGLGPLGMRVGDVVCVLAGAKVPFVLRPLQQNMGVGGAYALVGEAYCDGVMDGEVFTLELPKVKIILM